MLGTLVLIVMQAVGSWWLSNKLFEVLPLTGLPKLIVLVIFVSLIVWIIGIVASEIIKDVIKPSPNVLMSSMFVAGAIVLITIVPLFSKYVIPIKETYLPGIDMEFYPIIGAIAGYFMSK